MQHVFNPVELQRVARIGAALKPRNYVVLLREHVHNFPFSFVAPLESKQYVYVHGVFVLA
jgi:hypothetical protein